MMLPPLDSSQTLLMIRLMASVALLINSTEQLRNWRDYGDDGLLSWKIARLQTIARPLRAIAPLAEALFSFPSYLGVVVFRALAAGVLLVPHLPPAAEWTALGIVVLTSQLSHYRHIFGQDGSDQLLRMLFIVLLLVSFFPGDEAVGKAGLWFVALQSTLAYFAAGVMKTFGPAWRNGDAVFLVLNTPTFGMRQAALLLRERRPIARVLTWSTVAMECLFPLALIAGPRAALVFLAWGFTFHLANAVLMGLNSFLFTFVATYPAILFCAARG
ncbi:MAG TPA: hypothetical protein VEY88_26545 [Archangium sp.]|nr:hypothetical protein [Archangium sp.]